MNFFAIITASGVFAAVVAAAIWSLRRAGDSWPRGFALGAWLVVSGGALSGAFSVLSLNIEQHDWLLWIWTVVSAVAGGAAIAFFSRGVPAVEIFLGIVTVLGAAGLRLVFSGLIDAEPRDLSFSSPEMRVLLVAPAVLGLATYFGASVGYLTWGGSGKTDLRLGYEALIGRRFLLSKSTPALSVVTTISVLGVALGVWLVIVALGVLAGFEHDLQKKIIGANAHLVLQQNGGKTFELADQVLDEVAKVSGVVANAPFLEGEVAIASRSNYTGALFFGIDPDSSPDVLDVLRQLSEGSLEGLAKPPASGDAADVQDDDKVRGDSFGFAPPAAAPRIVIGLEMSKMLNVRVGDKIRVISPLIEEMTPVGMVPSSQAFEVAAIFSSKMYEFDARYAYTDLASARRFYDVGPKVVSGVQVKVEDPDYAARVGGRAARELSAKGIGDFDVLDWKTRDQTLFAALKLERVVAFVVLVFIILVASFSIVNTLTMSIIEKKKEIAILKTIGARDVGIMKLFLVQGMLVGVFGTLLGTIMAVVTTTIVEKIGVWIPGDVYYIDALPVSLEASDVVLAMLAAMLIVWDFAVFPALKGSMLEPVDGLRDG